MQTSHLRKISVLIEKKMMTHRQLQLITVLIHRPNTTVDELANICYGALPDGQTSSSFRIRYIRKYLKELILKLDYWGLPHIITVGKDGTVKLTMKEEDSNGKTNLPDNKGGSLLSESNKKNTNAGG